MNHGLSKEIKQTKPFSSLQEEAYLNIARTAAVLEHRLVEVLRDSGITPTQYNVLRILRGAEPVGLCRNEVRDRLVAQVPDATRLLDRMAEMGLVTRVRDTDDRRFVTARITSKGLRLLQSLEIPVVNLQKKLFTGFTQDELRTVIELLERARAVL